MAATPPSRYNRLTIEIEHCVDCEDHLHCTHHDSRKYEEYARRVQETIAEVVDEHFVFLVNPPPDVGRRGEYRFLEDQFCSHFYVVRDAAGLVLRRFRYPQLGAFEVYLHNPFTNQKLCIFSKLAVGRWPDPSVVADRVKRALSSGPSVSFLLFGSHPPRPAPLRTRPAGLRSKASLSAYGDADSRGSRAKLNRAAAVHADGNSTGHRGIKKQSTPRAAAASRALSPDAPASPVSDSSPAAGPEEHITVSLAEQGSQGSDKRKKKKKDDKRDEHAPSSPRATDGPEGDGENGGKATAGEGAERRESGGKKKKKKDDRAGLSEAGSGLSTPREGGDDEGTKKQKKAKKSQEAGDGESSEPPTPRAKDDGKKKKNRAKTSDAASSREPASTDGSGGEESGKEKQKSPEAGSEAGDPAAPAEGQPGNGRKKSKKKKDKGGGDASEAGSVASSGDEKKKKKKKADKGESSAEALPDSDSGEKKKQKKKAEGEGEDSPRGNGGEEEKKKKKKKSRDCDPGEKKSKKKSESRE